MKKLLLAGISFVAISGIQAQNCADIFISEYVEGSNNNKAIELYNPTASPIVLDGHYSMGRDRDGAGAPMLLAITGTIAPFDVRVFALDKRDPNGTGQETPLDAELIAAADTFLNPVYVQSNSPMYFNGDDAFVLVKDNVTILDIVGRIGEDPGSGWWVPGDPFTRWWTTDNTLIRKSAVQHGVMTNPDVFDPSLEWDSLPNNTFSELGTHSCVCGEVSVQERMNHIFSVFPNPVVAGQFSITASHGLAGITLYAADGRVVMRKQITGGQQYQNIELPESEGGLYILEIEFADGTTSRRKILSR